MWLPNVASKGTWTGVDLPLGTIVINGLIVNAIGGDRDVAPFESCSSSVVSMSIARMGRASKAVNNPDEILAVDHIDVNHVTQCPLHS